MPDLVRENRFCSIDEEERGLTCWLGGGGANGPHHGLELVVPAPAAGLELRLEGPSLEASQDLRVGVFGLAIAPRMCHRSIADLRSKVSTACLEEIASELRTIVGDDAVRDTELTHEALDELNCGPDRDGADGLHLCPFGKLFDGDVEVVVAPRRLRERA